MAGNYPDVPSHRIAYDRDGTAVVHINGAGTITELTTAQKQALNDETISSSFGILDDNDPDNYIALIFAELRDILGYFVMQNTGSLTPLSLEKSTDTTNGQDGTWVTVVNPYTSRDDDEASNLYRSAINSISALGIKGLRFKMDPSPGSSTDPVNMIHLYGGIASGQTSYLKFWQPSPTDAEVAGAFFDWGNTPRGSSADKTFRIKNTHGTLTANSITISVEALTDTAPSVPGQFLLSTDGVTFTASINIGNLASGAISGTLYVRRNTASNAVLGVWAARLLAIAGNWT